MFTKVDAFVFLLLGVLVFASPQMRTAVQRAREAPAGSGLFAAIRGWQEPGEAHEARLNRFERAHPGVLVTLID